MPGRLRRMCLGLVLCGWTACGDEGGGDGGADGGPGGDAGPAGDGDGDGDPDSGPGSADGGPGSSASGDSGSEGPADTGSGDSGSGGMGISQDYPGDVGIDGHPSVIFFEDFEDSDVGTLTAGWDNATLPEALSLMSDVPAGAVAGSQSLLMSVDSGSGVTLYQSLPDQDGQVFVRYYARYNTQSDYHHTGMWVGGYNPPTPWPQGNAGLRPSGSDFFNNTFEPAGAGGPLSFDHYAYWPGMQCLSEPGGCWGNHLLGSTQPTVPADTWVCMELMIGMNTPGQSDGSFGIWMDDTLVQLVEPGTPFTSNGVGGWEPDAGGQPFPGFNWRSTGDFGMNWIWLDFFTGGPSSMGWDQVVVATERVGCMAPA